MNRSTIDAAFLAAGAAVYREGFALVAEGRSADEAAVIIRAATPSPSGRRRPRTEGSSP